MTDAVERIWVTEMPTESRMGGCHAYFLTGAVEYTLTDIARPKVKPLVWGYHPCGEIASTGMGSAYIIDKRDAPRVRWVKWPGGHGPERETVEGMKAAAQADFERRVLACIETP